MTELLRQRAERIEHYADSHLIDPHGVVYTFIDKTTDRPLTDQFFAGFDAYSVPGYTPSEFYGYENCGMTTGAYMQALLYRYAVENDNHALVRARRCFEAQKTVYDMGKQLAEGFFPKVYGYRFSTQTSTDQVLYTVMALDRFWPVATDAERKEIDRMITHMVRFWVDRQYRYTYFNLTDMQWPLARFPSLLMLAFKHSGDPVFKREYDRLLAMGVNRQPGEQQLGPKLAGEWPPSEYEQSQQAWCISHIAGCVGMDVMELDYLLRTDPGNEWSAAWRASAEQMWREGNLALAPDGKEYSSFLLDFITREVRRPKPGLIEDKSYVDLDSWSFSRYIHGACSGFSTMIARSGVQMHRYQPTNVEIIPTVIHILTAMDVMDLTYYDEPERFAPPYRYLTDFISGDSLANWLWAYWQGRMEGMFNEDM
ncbi:MAG: hypothetical protein GXY55_19585 [Phycisphaerae bacterium]|nr:hypothetical protein [Phycisphaerae bacterium]